VSERTALHGTNGRLPLTAATILQFDPAAHRYPVNGTVWPSVTQVLDLLQDWSRVPLAALFAALLVLLATCRRDEPTCDEHPGPGVRGTMLDCNAFLRSGGQ